MVVTWFIVTVHGASEPTQAMALVSPSGTRAQPANTASGSEVAVNVTCAPSA